MSCFVDTSGIFAVLDADDLNHAKAANTWRRLLEEGTPLITSNYILVEATALLQHRIGISAVKVLRDDITPVMEVEWVDASTHQETLGELLLSGRRKLSLVDCVSFTVMRRLGILTAFTYDKHFRENGFKMAEP